MNRHLHIVLAGLALMALVGGLCSCSKQERGSSAELGQSGKCPLAIVAAVQEGIVDQSRASVIQDAVLPATFTIHTTAWLTPGDGAAGRTYFYDAPFRKNDEGKWQCETYKYWPVGGILDFLCIAVDDSVMPLSDFDAFVWNYTRSTNSVTIDVPNTQNMQSDLLFASARPTDRSAQVPMEFKHSQAQLVFRFGTADPGLVRLDSLTIGGIYMQGKLKVTNPVVTPVNPTASWNYYYSYPVIAYVPGVKNSIPTATATQTERIILVPAQPVGEITLYYTKRNSTTADWSTGSPYTATITPLTPSWEMGKKYIYEITFGHHDNTVTIPANDSYVTVTEFVGNWTTTLVLEN